jgi:hypothetical protein
VIVSRRVAVGCLMSALYCSSVGSATDQNAPTFLDELVRGILRRSTNFEVLGPNLGWRGLGLAQPGTSISPLVEAYYGVAGGLAQSLANVVVFDRPVIQLKDGYVSFGLRSLDTQWSEILKYSRPQLVLPKDRQLSSAVMKWLFRPILKSGKIIGYSREPSKYLIRYREFESMFTVLRQGQQNGLWRLDPRLSRYKEYNFAFEDVVRNWQSSGYKAEVEAATWTSQSSAGGEEWSNWSSSNEKFENHRIPIDAISYLPETYLFPPAASWSSVSGWTRIKSTSGDGEYRLQVARVKIERPWFDIDALVNGKLRLNAGSPTLSDGSTPTSGTFPSGALAGFVEEMVICRDIRFFGTAPDAMNPLGSFAFPDGINLLGYVLRVLPKLSG